MGLQRPAPGARTFAGPAAGPAASPPADQPQRLPVAPRCLFRDSPPTVAAIRAPPRGGARRVLRGSSRIAAAPPLSREDGGVRELRGRRRREGHLTVAAGSAPALGVGRSPLCFAADYCASVGVLELGGGKRRCGPRTGRVTPCSVPAPEPR